MDPLRGGITVVALTVSIVFLPVASAQHPESQKTLYERLGGLKGITVVVDDFIDRLVVPAAEQKELFNLVSKFKADIVVER